MRQNQSLFESKEEFMIICSIINFLLTRTQIVGGQKQGNIKLALKPNNRQASKKLGRLRPGDTFSQQMVAADQTRTQPPAWSDPMGQPQAWSDPMGRTESPPCPLITSDSLICQQAAAFPKFGDWYCNWLRSQKQQQKSVKAAAVKFSDPLHRKSVGKPD